jgi:hypothetical protein
MRTCSHCNQPLRNERIGDILFEEGYVILDKYACMDHADEVAMSLGFMSYGEAFELFKPDPERPSSFDDPDQVYYTIFQTTDD